MSIAPIEFLVRVEIGLSAEAQAFLREIFHIGRDHDWSSSPPRGVGSDPDGTQTTITHAGAAMPSECPEYAGTAAPTYAMPRQPGGGVPFPVEASTRAGASILENDTRGVTSPAGEGTSRSPGPVAPTSFAVHSADARPAGDEPAAFLDASSRTHAAAGPDVTNPGSAAASFFGDEREKPRTTVAKSASPGQWTHEKIATAIKLRRQFRPTREIAAALGISASYVDLKFSELRKAGVVLPSWNRAMARWEYNGPAPGADDQAVADFIAKRGITKLPAAYAAPSTAEISDADKEAHRARPVPDPVYAAHAAKAHRHNNRSS